MHLNLTAHPPVLRVWRILLTLAALFAAFVVALALRPGTALWWALTAVWALVFVLAYALYLPRLQRSLGLTLAGSGLTLRAGVFTHTLRHVPLQNVQYTRIIGTPLHRWCGLCTLLIVCAGASARMPGLREAEARQVTEVLFNGRG